MVLQILMGGKSSHPSPSSRHWSFQPRAKDPSAGLLRASWRKVRSAAVSGIMVAEVSGMNVAEVSGNNASGIQIL